MTQMSHDAKHIRRLTLLHARVIYGGMGVIPLQIRSHTSITLLHQVVVLFRTYAASHALDRNSLYNGHMPNLSNLRFSDTHVASHWKTIRSFYDIVGQI